MAARFRSQDCGASFTGICRLIVPPDTDVTDTRSGLQRAPDPNIMMGWDQAKEYIHSLKLGDLSCWRMPARAEPRSVNGVDATFPLNDCSVWTAESRADQTDWYEVCTGILATLPASTTIPAGCSPSALQGGSRIFFPAGLLSASRENVSCDLPGLMSVRVPSLPGML